MAGCRIAGGISGALPLRRRRTSLLASWIASPVEANIWDHAWGPADLQVSSEWLALVCIRATIAWCICRSIAVHWFADAHRWNRLLIRVLMLWPFCFVFRSARNFVRAFTSVDPRIRFWWCVGSRSRSDRRFSAETAAQGRVERNPDV